MLSIVGYEFGGQYRTDDNVILEVDGEENRRVRFRPTSAEDTPEAMEQLELAYLEARDGANINQLLLIPCVILDFLQFTYSVVFTALHIVFNQTDNFVIHTLPALSAVME